MKKTPSPTNPNRSVEAAANAAARSVLGSRSDVVEEVVNTVRAKLAQRQAEHRAPENPAAWASQVAKHQAMRAKRVEDRYPKGLQELDDTTSDAYLPMPADSHTPYDSVDLGERWAALMDLLHVAEAVVNQNLKGSDAELFSLVYVGKLKLNEAAQALGLNEPAVRKQWSRLVERLSRDLRQQLQANPLILEVFGEVMANEATFRHSLLGLLKAASQFGLRELQRLCTHR